MKLVALAFIILSAIGVASSFRLGRLFTLKRQYSQCTHICGGLHVDANDPTNTLYTVPNTIATLQQAVRFIQWWATEQSQTGSVVEAQNVPNGVEFYLENSKLSLLDVFALEDGTNTRIQLVNHKHNRDEIVGSRRQLLPLLNLIVNNLIDSLNGEVASTIVDHFDANQENEQRHELPEAAPTVPAEDVDNVQVPPSDDEFRTSNIKYMEQDPPEIVYEGGTNAVTESASTNLLIQEDKNSSEVSSEVSKLRVFSSQDSISMDPRVLYEWDTANTAMVALAIQNWADKYKIGVGFEVTHTVDGVSIGFAMKSAQNLVLNIRVQSVSQGCAQVISKLVCSSPETDENALTLDSLVQFAVKNLEKSLASELGGINIPSAESPVPPLSGASAGAGGTQKSFELHIPMDSQADIDEAFGAFGVAHARSKKAQVDPVTSASQTEPPPRTKRKDPITMQKAAQIGVRLENFENAGLEEEAAKELNALLQNKKDSGFLSVIKTYRGDEDMSIEQYSAEKIAAGIDESHQKPKQARSVANGSTASHLSPAELEELFKAGQRMSTLTLEDILQRPTQGETIEELRKPTPTMPISLPGRAISTGEGLDIFQSPQELQATLTGGTAPALRPLDPSSLAGQREMDLEYDADQPPDASHYELDNLRLETLLTTLNQTAPELHDLVIDGYRDLLMSENIIFLLKRAHDTTESSKMRDYFKKLTDKAVSLVAEMAALFKVESARHLQTIHEVCKVASECANDDVMFLDQMDHLKSRFDTQLLAYLNHAISEEMSRIRKKGFDPALAPSEWLQVLTIVHKGVIAEFESRYSALLESLLLVVRWDRDGDDELRSELFRRIVAITPAMDLAHLKELATNMIDNILQKHAIATGALPRQPLFGSASWEEDLPPEELAKLAKQMQNLRTDVDAHLSDAYIAAQMAAFEEEARAQGTAIGMRHRNLEIQDEMETSFKMAQQAKRTMDYDEEDSARWLGSGD